MNLETIFVTRCLELARTSGLFSAIVEVLHDIMGTAKIVVHPRSLSRVPTAECILAHLPKDRLPTADELRHAWRACSA